MSEVAVDEMVRTVCPELTGDCPGGLSPTCKTGSPRRPNMSVATRLGER